MNYSLMHKAMGGVHITYLQSRIVKLFVADTNVETRKQLQAYKWYDKK